jgi:hypothetical protein
MNKILKISFFAFAIFLLSDTSAFAQRRPSKKEKTDEPADAEKTEETTTRPTRSSAKTTDKYFDESGGFKHRLWYGGNFVLGLNGSSFAVGITPMVGYKIFEGFSVGPRIGLIYRSDAVFSAANPNQSLGRVSSVDYSLGAFTRYKFLGFLFLHAEYGYSSQSSGDVISNGNGGFTSVKNNRFNPYLGGGYNSSNGLFGYEIALLYDPTLPSTANISPLDIRFGFNYNF